MLVEWTSSLTRASQIGRQFGVGHPALTPSEWYILLLYTPFRIWLQVPPIEHPALFSKRHIFFHWNRCRFPGKADSILILNCDSPTCISCAIALISLISGYIFLTYLKKQFLLKVSSTSLYCMCPQISESNNINNNITMLRLGCYLGNGIPRAKEKKVMKDRYRLPIRNDVSDGLERGRHFSTLDLASRYH